MKRELLVMLTLVSVVACSSTDDEVPEQVFKGEQLIQPMPLPGGTWERFIYTYPDAKRINWGLVGKKDVLEVVEFFGEELGDLAAYRMRQDKADAAKCASFESELLDTVVRNGYQEMLWQTQCVELETERSLFSYHLSISGHDSFFVLSRRWPYMPKQSSKNAWLDYFSDVMLCDDRLEARPCPY
ncbi:hypothetical protein EZV61_18240 [Corallincola luteus]|uniref:Lipoprotein n=1 Tax=Corallincola luteus TaxID=1775177 RepID=A0ABY2AFW1_9GAMM|nr:hypothetical protein [Corallincola luteus]TCI01330.1 hypothetical protein EZV61_18240 [Corallincola luteus]